MLDWPLLSTAGLSGKPPEDQRGREEGGHSNRRTRSANTPRPLCLFFLSPYSYAPVSASPTPALSVNICLVPFFKSPSFPLGFSLNSLSLFLISPKHPLTEVQPEPPCFQMTQQQSLYRANVFTHRLFHMSLYYEAKRTLYHWPGIYCMFRNLKMGIFLFLEIY